MRVSTKARIAILGVAASALLSAGPAFANGGQRSATKSGPCTSAATWKLQAKPDGGQIEVQFEVDGIAAGQNWRVVLRDNKVAFFSGNRMAVAPADSFSVNRRTANLTGSDKITGRAVNSVTGEVCKGSITV